VFVVEVGSGVNPWVVLEGSGEVVAPVVDPVFPVLGVPRCVAVGGGVVTGLRGGFPVRPDGMVPVGGLSLSGDGLWLVDEEFRVVIPKVMFRLYSSCGFVIDRIPVVRCWWGGERWRFGLVLGRLESCFFDGVDPDSGVVVEDRVSSVSLPGVRVPTVVRVLVPVEELIASGRAVVSIGPGLESSLIVETSRGVFNIPEFPELPLPAGVRRELIRYYEGLESEGVCVSFRMLDFINFNKACYEPGVHYLSPSKIGLLLIYNVIAPIIRTEALLEPLG